MGEEAYVSEELRKAEQALDDAIHLESGGGCSGDADYVEFHPGFL